MTTSPADLPALDAAAVAALGAALAPFVRGPVAAATLHAWAVACAQATPHGCTLIAEGYGTLHLDIERHWPTKVRPAPSYQMPRRPVAL